MTTKSIFPFSDLLPGDMIGLSGSSRVQWLEVLSAEGDNPIIYLIPKEEGQQVAGQLIGTFGRAVDGQSNLRRYRGASFADEVAALLVMTYGTQNGIPTMDPLLLNFGSVCITRADDLVFGSQQS